MRRAIYVSESLIGEEPDGLAAILAVSQARNAEVGVTGILWWAKRTFAQVLEGDPEAVGQVLARINRDPRHANIDMVEDIVISGRLFGNWAMFQADGGAESASATGYLVGMCATKGGMGPRRLFNFLVDSGY